MICKPDKLEWKAFSKLSGGQQALCACVLSLAMQKTFPSPVFFCDELDASLDTRNIRNVALLLDKTSKTGNCQFVCVSLRHQMYEVSPQLIGVYTLDNSSRTIRKSFIASDQKHASVADSSNLNYIH